MTCKMRVSISFFLFEKKKDNSHCYVRPLIPASIFLSEKLPPLESASEREVVVVVVVVVVVGSGGAGGGG